MSRLARVRTVAKRVRYRYFPERQLYFRANGVVRFISVSPRAQILGTGVALALVGWVAWTSFNFLARDEMLEAKDRKIEDMARQYDSLNAEMQRLQVDVKTTTKRLRARQDYLRDLVGDDEADAPDAAPPTPGQAPQSNASQNGLRPMAFLFSAFGDGKSKASKASDRVASIENELAALETRQRGIANRLLKLTRHEISLADQVIRKTGLNKDRVLTVATEATASLGEGGPYTPSDDDALFATEGAPTKGTASSDDSFVALYNSRNELATLESALASMPVAKPVKNYYISSGFGRRIDPMRKRPAVHYGVDMAGWWNRPVMASGDGVVTFAGRNGAYGNFIEIAHGYGFKSRYGHLNRIKVKKGQRVERGQVVGLMGSTGRSTGPHLHYEIWFAGKPRNPINFFKAKNDVLKIEQHYSVGAG